MSPEFAVWVGICSDKNRVRIKDRSSRVESGDGRSRSGLEERWKGKKWYVGSGLWGFPSVLVVPLNKLREAKKKRVTRGWGAAATGACWLDED